MLHPRGQPLQAPCALNKIPGAPAPTAELLQEQAGAGQDAMWGAQSMQCHQACIKFPCRQGHIPARQAQQRRQATAPLSCQSPDHRRQWSCCCWQLWQSIWCHGLQWHLYGAAPKGGDQQAIARADQRHESNAWLRRLRCLRWMCPGRSVRCQGAWTAPAGCGRWPMSHSSSSEPPPWPWTAAGGCPEPCLCCAVQGVGSSCVHLFILFLCPPSPLEGAARIAPSLQQPAAPAAQRQQSAWLTGLGKSTPDELRPILMCI